jgi:hypothetical protein
MVPDLMEVGLVAQKSTKNKQKPDTHPSLQIQVITNAIGNKAKALA